MRDKKRETEMGRQRDRDGEEWRGPGVNGRGSPERPWSNAGAEGLGRPGSARSPCSGCLPSRGLTGLLVLGYDKVPSLSITQFSTVYF